MSGVLFDVAVASVPSLALASVTWRLVWPKWKLYGKLLVHPAAYAALSVWIGHWSILIAWLHQGLGLAGHIWFCRRHGWTWYAVEDPERYVAASKAAVERLKGSRSAAE